MTDTPVPAGAIVVGIDGSPASDAALEWAAAEAARTGTAVHLVHSYVQPLIGMAGGMAVYDLQMDEAATALLDEARERVLASAPGAEVTTSSRIGPASSSLLRAGREASIIAVGHRGRGALAGALLGSTALQVAIHATCPTVVVRGPEEADDVDTAAADTAGTESRGGRIVVGIDGSATSADAMAQAFERAQACGAELVVVSAWTWDLAFASMAPLATTDVHDRIQEEQTAMVTRAVETLTATRDGVTVRKQVAQGDPADVLVKESIGADLLVVGSRGRGGFRSLLLGSVSLKVLQRAQCPVMVVRPRGGEEAEIAATETAGAQAAQA